MSNFLLTRRLSDLSPEVAGKYPSGRSGAAKRGPAVPVTEQATQFEDSLFSGSEAILCCSPKNSCRVLADPKWGGGFVLIF
jgi:hypothetical protein